MCQVYRDAMKHLRIALLVFLACKPVAESQTVQPRQAGAQIPASVSVARRTPVVVVARNVLASVMYIHPDGTMRRLEADPFFDPLRNVRGRMHIYSSLRSVFGCV